MMQKIKPHIGKNVIETLTTGMYEDPKFIYREYVQNAADQIDIAVEKSILSSRKKGSINITIDNINKNIVVEDNATGIESSKIRKFLGDVANSEKDPNLRKGFRGIGRLGGLAYCEKLIFETSYKGEEIKSIMILDSKFLKSIIEDANDKRDASSVISVITRISVSNENKEAHYFKVTLENVLSEEILNFKKVTEYLSMVAPVELAPTFSFKEKITNHFKLKNIFWDEYNVKVNNVKIYKAYKDTLIFLKGNKKNADITSVGFFDVKDDEAQLLAVGWYGISNKINYVIEEINFERGIRVRKNNITIGNEKTLFECFKTERTNLRYIGEIHTVSNGFTPNARRDYFNESKTIEQFEKSLKKIFDDFESRLPHIASNLHNRLRTIIESKQLIRKYKKDVDSFQTTIEQDQRKEEVIRSITNAETAIKQITKIAKEGESDPTILELFKSIVGDDDYSISEKETEGIYEEKIYPPLRFSKVNKDKAAILNEVVIFLQQELGHSQAAGLIKKLQTKYD